MATEGGAESHHRKSTVVAGHAYGSIKRLIEAELIEESDERPAPELDDARRRYYRLTALGTRVLDAECERLQELVRAIQVKRSMVTE